MARNFNDLKKEKTIAELNKFCREVAIDYATSAKMESREKRAERFDIFRMLSNCMQVGSDPLFG